MFSLKFETDNDAFGENLRAETARVLQEVCRKLAGGREGGHVFDVNGNKIGEWSLDLNPEE